MTPAFEAWTATARSVRIENEIARRGIKLNGNGAERVGPCPACGGQDRFAINTKKQVFNCRGCGAKGRVIDLVMFLDGVDFVPACTTLAGPPPPKANGKDRATEPKKKIVVAEFVYENADCGTAFAVERIELQNTDDSFVLKDGKNYKTFRQKRPNPDRPGKWINNVTDKKGNLLVPVVPYRLPELIEAVGQEHTILIVEGEAKVDLLRSWNIPATCCAGGAGKWRAEHSECLRDADVVILPDNDDAGRRHLAAVAGSLQGIAKTVRVLELPGLPAKGDVIDWANAGGGTVERLHALIEKAEPWTPPAVIESAAAVNATGDEISLDDFYAYLPQHNYIFAPTRDVWPAASVNARLPAIFGGPDSKPISPAQWLDDNRRVEQMTWAPGLPRLIKGKLIYDGGFIDQPDCAAFNLYMPPIIKPVAGDVTPWLELVHKVFPNEAAHIILWLAHRVQRPHEKINHALVLGGKQGIGKDTILYPVRHAVGPWNCQSISPKEALEHFSGYLKTIILQINEARDLGDF
jgi:hypothetical protein